MEIHDLKIEEIIPYARNPRDNAAAIDGVAASIKEFGFQQPLVVNKDRVLVVGHTRLQAAKKLGIEIVPCVIAENLTEQQIKAYRILDNKLGEKAQWNIELLKLELDEIEIDLADFDCEMTGLDNIAEIEPPVLEDSDRGDVQQMAFKLHVSQIEIVQNAIKKCQQEIDVENSINPNKNGNAITIICEAFLNG